MRIQRYYSFPDIAKRCRLGVIYLFKNQQFRPNSAYYVARGTLYIYTPDSAKVSELPKNSIIFAILCLCKDSYSLIVSAFVSPRCRPEFFADVWGVMITILCAKKNSLYKTIPGLDVWDEDRDAYFFTGSNPVITHAPCAQWSRMNAFSNPDTDAKELAFFCLNKVIRNGGIFEHPAGSSFFKEAGVTRNIYSVDQSWWGFPARKRTYLFFHKCKPLAFPVLQYVPTHVVAVSSKLGPHQRSLRTELSKSQRSTTVVPFAQWMIDCIKSAA